MVLGIPKEILTDENRVAAIPETVEKYVKKGFKVLVETDAGKGIHVSDSEYKKVGAKISTDVESLFKKADVIIKVKQPIYNEKIGKHEIDMMKRDSILVTFLHPAAPSNHENVKMLCKNEITSLTMDCIPRTLSHAQIMDALTSMSTVTGYRAVLIAAQYLPKFVPMIATAIGTTKPAKFLIIGVGVVGLQSLATAKRLGGIITAVDIRPEAREQATSLGAKVGGFEAPSELALGEGGYAKSLPEKWLAKEREAIASLVEDADVVIATALVPGEEASILITEEMVKKMKPGSVIVDVAIDQGGNCAVTESGKTVVKHDVVVCGTQNIPGAMPVDSSWLYANNMYYYIENLLKEGLGNINLEDEVVKSSLVTYKGKIVHTGTLKALGEA